MSSQGYGITMELNLLNISITTVLFLEKIVQTPATFVTVSLVPNIIQVI
jgi:hypothetical protein